MVTGKVNSGKEFLTMEGEMITIILEAIGNILKEIIIGSLVCLFIFEIFLVLFVKKKD